MGSVSACATASFTRSNYDRTAIGRRRQHDDATYVLWHSNH
ncbi:unnamed protein product [Amoebophrya sp. A25]|nr:unnamed protein product [Amoebophrya sp. A25]|eukprot:GSA25T00018072001.1